MAIIKVKFDRAVEGASNIVDTGTEGTRVATGSTAQRGTTAGQLRYNTTSNRFEGKNATGVTEIFASPSISSVDDVEVDSQAGGNQTFVITGANFASGDEVSFVGNDGTTVTASSTTVDSATQITAVIAKSSFDNTKEPYDIKITSSNNTIGILSNIINVDNPVSWTTASGNLGTINHDVNATHFTLVATDPDGDTITYSEVGNNLSASGLSLNSSTGEISGDPTDQSVGGSTTYSFTVRATANGKTADRDFNIIVQNPPEYIQATGGTISYDGDYKIHTMPYDTGDRVDVTTNFVVSEVGTNPTYGDKIWYLIVGGGGSADGGFKGSNSTAFGLTAYGGGAGSKNGGSEGDGGSGGGGRGDSSITAGSGIPGQGNNGGNGYDPSPETGGGGGGAGSSGGTGGSQGGAGGTGLQNSITGTAIYYAGGGAGGSGYTNTSVSGGAGGGGNGAGGYGGGNYQSSNTQGTDGLGGGGGAGVFGGGGGAGGLLTNGATATYNFTITAQTYPCVVGGGSGTGSTSGGAGTIIIRYKYQ